MSEPRVSKTPAAGPTASILRTCVDCKHCYIEPFHSHRCGRDSTTDLVTGEIKRSGWHCDAERSVSVYTKRLAGYVSPAGPCSPNGQCWERKPAPAAKSALPPESDAPRGWLRKGLQWLRLGHTGRDYPLRHTRPELGEALCAMQDEIARAYPNPNRPNPKPLTT